METFIQYLLESLNRRQVFFKTLSYYPTWDQSRKSRFLQKMLPQIKEMDLEKKQIIVDFLMKHPNSELNDLGQRLIQYLGDTPIQAKPLQ